MAITDANGLPVSIWTTSASHHEVKLVEQSLDWMMVNRPKMLIGDRAYDSNELRAKMNQKSVELIVPYRRNRKYNITQDKRKLRRYRKRWKVERFFAWLHNYRRCVIRYDHYNINFEGFVLLATLAIYLKKYF
jgi:transposase